MTKFEFSGSNKTVEIWGQFYKELYKRKQMKMHKIDSTCGAMTLTITTFVTTTLSITFKWVLIRLGIVLLNVTNKNIMPCVVILNVEVPYKLVHGQT